jgi:branched-chain amino acid transport system ATP-binding protein
MTAPPVLDVRDLQAAYGESLVLQGVSLAVRAGEVAAVLGRNGAGKTTLVRAIAGLTPPRAGRVLLRGEDVTGAPAHEIARRGVGLVPQGRRLFASLAVGEHLAVGARPRPGHHWDVRRVLDLFPRLRERLRQRAITLSGGEQGMLACGRALVGNPIALLMDEPSEGLAPLLVRDLGRILATLRAEGAAILLVEQNLPFALRVADRVHLMSRGRIVHACAPEELARDDALKSRYLGV